MNPITHALVSWCFAETVPSLPSRERAIIVIAGVSPDLDAIGMPVELMTRDTAHPLLWWSSYHHLLGHNLLFACAATAMAAAMARTRRGLVAAMAFVAIHLHYLCDILGSRGPDGYEWPIPYFVPFSSMEFSWSGEWALNAWPNIAITVALLMITFALAWHRGYSPLCLFWPRADALFVAALRARVPHRRASLGG